MADQHSQGGSAGSNPVGATSEVAGQGPGRYYSGRALDHLSSACHRTGAAQHRDLASASGTRAHRSLSQTSGATIPRHLVSGERSWVREAYGPGCRAADAGAGLVRGRSHAGRAIDRLAGQPLAVYMASGHAHIVACVNDDGVIRKEQPSQWPGIRRGRALSAAKALGSR